MTDPTRRETLDDVVRAGRGALVLCEGETAQDDAWVLGRWFGHLSHELTFVARNGWPEVVATVARLRRDYPGHAIFGLRDRDLTPEAAYPYWHHGVPEDGVFLLPRSMIEAYLLEPEGWLAVLNLLLRNALPAGWQDLPAVAHQLDEAWRSCLPLAAWRMAKADFARRDPAATLPRDPGWQTSMNDLERMLTALERGLSLRPFLEELDDPAVWSAQVPGKAVLAALIQRLPLKGKPERSYLQAMYLSVWGRAPADLVSIMNRVLSEARRQRATTPAN